MGMKLSRTVYGCNEQQESRAVAGKPRDAALNFDTQCLRTFGSIASKVLHRFVTIDGQVVYLNYETFAPKNFRSRERKYHGMELSFPGTFAPGSESCWNFRCQELSLPGAKVPRTFAHNSLELSLPGTKVPRTFAPTPCDFRS